MTKEELVMYKICSLFAGVGGIDLGFLQTNNCEIAYANEFDNIGESEKYALKHGGSPEYWRDQWKFKNLNLNIKL